MKLLQKVSSLCDEVGLLSAKSLDNIGIDGGRKVTLDDAELTLGSSETSLEGRFVASGVGLLIGERAETGALPAQLALETLDVRSSLLEVL